ncbi:MULTISPECIES: TonB-dependent siderophore receptor [Bartonella]|uniref:TonB-dependent siderophore receptor n=1 Tax=Bartonella TaxID=773 RepID=UPI00350FAF8E
MTGVLAILLSSTMSGSADAGEKHDDEVLETVVVDRDNEKGDGPVIGYAAKQSFTATKTDTPIVKTPQSIAVVTKQQMEDQHVQSVAESLRYTPGVFTEYRGASNLRDEMFVRGFSYVPIYLDGLLLSGDASYAQINPYLLERVELISGPNSVLYGQTNPGGIVNAVSKRPQETPFHEVELSTGNRNQYGLSFDISENIPGRNDFFYRIVGTGISTDLQEQFARKKGYAFAPSLSWSPDKTTKLTLLTGYQKEPKAGYRNFLDADGTVRPIVGFGHVPRDFFVSDPHFERVKREQEWVGGEFSHVFDNGLTFRQKMLYHEVDMQQATLTWGAGTKDPDTGYNTLISRIASDGEDIWKQFASDSQLEAKFDTGAVNHTVLAGVDTRTRKRDYLWKRDRHVPSISLENPVYGGFDFDSLELPLSSREILDAKQTGTYVQEQASLGRLNLMGGIRHDWADTNLDDRYNSMRYRYKDKATTWRAGALYAFDNGIAPYISYSTSFEPALQAPVAGDSAFDPVTARQIEAGVKYSPLAERLILTAAYYDLVQKNVVEGKWDPSIADTTYQQIGKIHNKGVELSARGEVTRSISLIGAYSYIDSTIEDTIITTELDKTPSRIPAHQFSIWGVYDFLSGRVEGLKLGGGLRYLGTSWGDNANSFKVPDVTLVDAMLGYDFGAARKDFEGLSLQINVKNIADKRFVASCANAYACFYGDGRIIQASLKKTW